MAIEIKFLSNVVAFLKGTKDMGDALDDVGDSLDDVAKDASRAADKAGDELADGITDGVKDSEKSVDRLERTFKDMADVARRESKDAGDTMDRSMSDGAAGASEAIEEWGDEARQNMAETFSSFRGEAEDFVGIVQDTFGGVISNLGPLGMAFGAAGALGIGLFMGEQERAKEANAEFRAEVGELIGELIEIGDDPVEAMRVIADRIKRLATASEEGKTSLADLHDAAEGSVSGFRKLADAYAGNTDELEEMIEAEKELKRTAEEAFNQDKRWDAATTERLQKARDGQREVVKGLEEALAAAQEAEAGERAWLESNGPLYEARAEQMDTLQGELDEAIGAWGDYEDAETGALDPSGYIAGMQARMDATTNFNANVQTLAAQFGLTHEEVQAILDQGVDFAPMLQAIIDSGMGEEYANQIRAMLDGGQAIVDGTPVNTVVHAEADTDAATTELDAAATDRDTNIEVDTTATAADREINRVADRRRSATIDVYANTFNADRALANLTTPRTVYIDVIERSRQSIDW